LVFLRLSHYVVIYGFPFEEIMDRFREEGGARSERHRWGHVMGGSEEQANEQRRVGYAVGNNERSEA
jgi:hypothetical protein